MELSERWIQFLIAQGEGVSLEFKTCRNQLNRDVYETVCAFLNRHGGTLILGVADSGKIIGIDADALEQIRKDFVTAINNPQKLTPPMYLSIDAAMVDGKNLLVVQVPESSQVHRCNGRIYDRNEDGDLDITDQTLMVANLYQRKQASYTENRVYPWIQPADLRVDLIERCRRYVRINRKDHPWVDMDDTQLLKSARLIQIDPETRKSGITLGGVMLFGADDLVLQVCPAHRTDCILRKVDVDRYDDRDLVRTNLIDSYDRIQAFLHKHLADPFYLEGIERRSLRDIIFREVTSNILIHREYASGESARVIIEYGKVTTYNANRPHGFGPLDPETSVPFQKNPILGAFFREIDRADELGSGIRKMMLYGKRYGGADPQFIEGDIFKMIISVPEFNGPMPTKESVISGLTLGDAESAPTSRGQVGTKSGASRDQAGTRQGPSIEWQRILHLCLVERPILDLLQSEGKTNRTKFRNTVIKPLLQQGWLEMTIPDKPTDSRQKYRTTDAGKAVFSPFE